jgi:hypothetical protein
MTLIHISSSAELPIQRNPACSFSVNSSFSTKGGSPEAIESGT